MAALLTFEDQEARLRIIVTLDSNGRTALLDVLHNPRFSNLPRDPNRLYVELTNSHKVNLTKLKQKGVLRQKQWDLLFPVNQQTDSTKFDVTLCKLLIITCTNMPPPTNGWKRPLDINDVSIVAFVVKTIELRNNVMHAPNSTLTQNEFNSYWNDLEVNLKGLGHNDSIAYLKFLPFQALDEDTIKACYKMFNKTMQQKNEKYFVLMLLVIVVAAGIFAAGYFLKDSFGESKIDPAANEASDSLRSHYIKKIENKNLASICKYYRLEKRFYIEPSVVEVSDDLTRTESMMNEKGDIPIKDLLDQYQHDVLLLQGAG